MAFTHKPNSGSLFRNQRKETETQPDHTGNCDIEGKLFRISAWVNTSGAGTKYFSLKFTPADQIGQPARTPNMDPEDFADDDIPF